MQVRNIVLSFWFSELDYNPIDKVNELENNLGMYFQKPFFINETKPYVNLVMPRIMAYSLDKKSDLNISLTNMVSNIQVLNNFTDNDEVMMYVNEKMQLLFDILRDIYDVEVLYSSIKVELFNKIPDISLKMQKILLKEANDNLEDFILKRGLKKDNKYYVNYTISTTKEINVDIKLKEGVEPRNDDMLIRSMLVSLENTKVGSEILNNVIEVNDRLSFNNDASFRETNDSLRDLLFEFRKIFYEETKKEY